MRITWGEKKITYNVNNSNHSEAMALWNDRCMKAWKKFRHQEASLTSHWLLHIFLLCVGVGMQELSEGPLSVQELCVRAHLCDFSIHHHQDQVSLGQEAQPMGHQNPSLKKHHAWCEMSIRDVTHLHNIWEMALLCPVASPEVRWPSQRCVFRHVRPQRRAGHPTDTRHSCSTPPWPHSLAVSDPQTDSRPKITMSQD